MFTKLFFFELTLLFSVGTSESVDLGCHMLVDTLVRPAGCPGSALRK